MSTTADTPSTGLQSVSILVVDDSKVMRDLLSAILHGCGVGQVHLANNGQEGLDALYDLAPDIVIVDWMMEPIDGPEFVRLVRLGPDLAMRTVPIIMVTGHSQPKLVRQARDIGVTEFLAKPLSAKTVAERLEAIIHRPRPFVRTTQFFGPDRRRKVASFDGPDRRGSDSGEQALTLDLETIEKLRKARKQRL